MKKWGFKYFSRRLFLILISVIFQRLITVKVFETEIERFEGHSDFWSRVTFQDRAFFPTTTTLSWYQRLFKTDALFEDLASFFITAHFLMAKCYFWRSTLALSRSRPPFLFFSHFFNFRRGLSRIKIHFFFRRRPFYLSSGRLTEKINLKKDQDQIF